MVPNGFQHISGLGNFPSDWHVMTADCVTTKITKGTTPAKSEIVQDSNIPFLRVNNLSFNGRLNTSSEMLFVSRNAHEGFLSRSIAYPDDILMNIVGPPLGKISMLDNKYDSYNMNQAIVIYRTSPEKIDKYYFLKFLTSELAQQWLESRSKKTSGQQNLTIQLCKELPVPVPPRLEQWKIAKILSTWDKAISTTERLIDNSKQQKKALMQQLLTGAHTQRKRLLDDTGKPFEGEWEEVKLSNVAEVVMGSSPKSSAYNENSEGLPLIQGNADIKNRKSAPRIYTSEVTKKCSIGDILLSVRAPVGTIAKSEHEACIGRGISAISAKKHHVQEYLYQWLLWFEPRWEKYSQGSTFEAVNSNDIKSLHLAIPEHSEQAKIASVLSNADQEIELLEQQLADLKQEKKALMQQLLTGKRRVKVVDKEVA